MVLIYTWFYGRRQIFLKHELCESLFWVCELEVRSKITLVDEILTDVSLRFWCVFRVEFGLDDSTKERMVANCLSE